MYKFGRTDEEDSLLQDMQAALDSISNYNENKAAKILEKVADNMQAAFNKFDQDATALLERGYNRYAKCLRECSKYTAVCIIHTTMIWDIS